MKLCSDDPEHGLNPHLQDVGMFHRFHYDCSQNIGELELALHTEAPIAVGMPPSFRDGGKLNLLLKCARNHLQHNPNHSAGPLLKKLAVTALSADVHLFFGAFKTPTGDFLENPIMKQPGQLRTQKDFFGRLRKSPGAEILKGAFLHVVLGQHFEIGGTMLAHHHLSFFDLTINYSQLQRRTPHLWVSSERFRGLLQPSSCLCFTS